MPEKYSRRDVLKAGMVLGAAGVINPIVPPKWNTPMIGISNYEGLCNRLFDLPEYIRKRGGEGYKFIRVFTDLAWWVPPAGMSPKNSLFLYEYDVKTRRYDPSKINQAFVDKLYASGKAAKESGMEGIILCLATNPKYYAKSAHKSFPWQLGFRDVIGFMQVADPEWPQWEKWGKYVADLIGICKEAPNPFMFLNFETFNELKRWGSILDTHPAIQRIVKRIRSNSKLQFNPPIQELLDDQDFEWPKKVMDGYKGFKADRVSFHGIFNEKEVTRYANFMKKGGLNLDRITFETDGATPNGLFTRENSSQHYLWRLQWTDSPENVRRTIRTHRNMIEAAKDVGVTLNIQDVIKWSLLEDTPHLQKFYRELAREVAL